MQYVFDNFALNLDRGELLCEGEAVALEPRAFALLYYLIANAERLVTKEELVENIWDSRFISDAAISTVIKTVRKSLGDDGTAQKYIRTVHGRGFRFVSEVSYVTTQPASTTSNALLEEEVQPARDLIGNRPSIAVLPFKLIGSSEAYNAIAEAIPSEIIAIFSRLRWLKVIARGSTFRFRDTPSDILMIHQALGATYALTGDVELFEPSLAIAVELSDTRSGEVVWGDRLSGRLEDVHEMRDNLVRLVTSALELHIPQHEAELARLRSPETPDAWSHYHLGLQHMYRFNNSDNAFAAEHFRRAISYDPYFARAYSAQSFTSFQAAFLRYGVNRDTDIDNAMRFAEKSVELDPMDPFGNFTYGRAHWLRADPAAGQAWLERAMSLSPSFAQGFYAHGWAENMAGNGQVALQSVSTAISLSPLDPFLYAMLSSRGLAHLHNGEIEEASYWAEQGARKPGAHYLICAISAAIKEIAGDKEGATYWCRQTLERRPDASIEQFFAAFPFANPTVSKQLRTALARLGIREK